MNNLSLVLFSHSPTFIPVIFSPFVFIPLSFPLLLPSRFALNLEEKEGKEWKDGKEWKEVSKEAKEVESSRPVSVMSSLSYRKRSNLSSVGGKGDGLFSALKESAEPEDAPSFHKAKSRTLDAKDDTYSISSRRKSQAGDDLNGRETVMSQAYSEARRSVDSRWDDFDKESTVSFPAPSRASTRLGLSPDNDAKSTVSLGLASPLGRRRSTSRFDDTQRGRSLYGSSPSSPCFSRRSGGRSPGSVSQADSHMSLARSCRLSEFDVDNDDCRSVAFTERSAYSPHSSTGRSVSMPPPRARSSADSDPVDSLDNIKTVSHRNYLDPDLEKAINEVLSFKPIKFKRSSLEDSAAEEDPSKKDAYNPRDGRESGSSLRRSASAVDCVGSFRSASTCSSRHRSKSRGKSKKKKRSHSSDSDSSHRHRSSSKRRSKKSKKKSKKRGQSSSSSSSSSESESDSESSSGASTISYRSTNSVKRAPGQNTSDVEEGDVKQSESQPLNKKDEKKRKKKVDSLMMKYLYRPDSD